MRRIGAVAMTGAERTARWRQRRFEQATAQHVRTDLEQLPLFVDPEVARPVVEAWRSRGFMYAITPKQWATVADELTDPERINTAVVAIATAPAAPAPASAVWGAVMAAMQSIRSGLVKAKRAAVLAAVRAAVSPARVAFAHADEVRDGPYLTRARLEDDRRQQLEVDGKVGMDAWRHVGAKLLGRPACGCGCHRDGTRWCGECRPRHR